MISLPSRGIDYGGAEKRSKRSTILEKYLLLYLSLDDLFIGISILKTYHDFDSILLLFPNIIDEKDRRNRNNMAKRNRKNRGEERENREIR